MPELEHLLLHPATQRISYVAGASAALVETIVALGGSSALVAAA